MASSSNNTGLVITLSIFVVLSLGFGVAWYMSFAENTQTQTELATKTSEASKSSTELRVALADVATLKERIGQNGETDDVVKAVNNYVTTHLEDGATPDMNLSAALDKAVVDRNTHEDSAEEREKILKQRTEQFRQDLASRDGQIEAHRQARQQAEDMRQQAEIQHSEELKKINDLLDAERELRVTTEREFADFRLQKKREIDDLNEDIRRKRKALVDLRTILFKQEDLSFDQPDGLITFVDRNNNNCFINLGSMDGLRRGTTFSVYTKDNNGVGRRNREDIKGSIEVVAIRGPRLAEVRITDEVLRKPIAVNDPIYSPIFTSGQRMQIAVVGLLNFDAGPENDRELFRSIVREAGSEITVQVNDLGEFVTESGDPLQDDDIYKLITEKTKFLVIADIGDDNESQDPVKQALYLKIREQKRKLEEAAVLHGVYPVSLQNFMEFIGYSRKRELYTPTDEHPSVLPNGALSESANSRKRPTESLGDVSGLYSARRRGVTTSVGATSSKFK